jgi:hypothetical protein
MRQKAHVFKTLHDQRQQLNLNLAFFFSQMKIVDPKLLS